MAIKIEAASRLLAYANKIGKAYLVLNKSNNPLAYDGKTFELSSTYTVFSGQSVAKKAIDQHGDPNMRIGILTGSFEPMD